MDCRSVTRPLIEDIVLLVIATILLGISNGRWIVPVAAWLAPIFMLRFVESNRLWVVTVAGLAASFVAWSISWQGMIPAPGLLYYMVTMIYATVFFVPFVAHRLIASRSTSFLSTLVFPVAWVSIDFIFQRFVSPYGSWTSLAYTQVDFLSLTQLASVTGTFGVTFLVTWFGAVGAWLWKVGLRRKKVIVSTLAFGVPFVLVMAFGMWRIQTSDVTGPSLLVAAITPSETLTAAFFGEFRKVMMSDSFNEASQDDLLRAASRLNADLLRKTRTAVGEGANIIAWSETAAKVTPEVADSLDQLGREIVESREVLFAAAYGLWDPSSSPPLANVVSIHHSPDAAPTYYHKARPIIGAEAPMLAHRDSAVAIIDTGNIKLGVAICHDLDFPDLIRQAGRLRAQLMLGPSADWSEIEDMHATMATLRAVENGFTLVRPTYGGRTIAVDPIGREWEWSERDGVLLASVTASHVATVYSRFGDVFAWLCLAGFAVAVATSMSRR